MKEILLEITKNKIIVALDGAADRLAALRITPHIIIGDFDSIDMRVNLWGIDPLSSKQSYSGNFAVTIVHAADQNNSDLIKAIRYCDQQGAAQLEILCATGGRMDHHEGALRALRSEYKKERAIYLHTEQQTLSFAKNENFIIKGKIGDKCGVLAFPLGSFTSDGLDYEADKYQLEFGFAESMSNSFAQERIKLEVAGEALLILPPHYITQRNYAHLSLLEQLKLQLRDASLSACKES